MIEGKHSKNIGCITIGGKEYDVFIARSEKQKERGLQGFSNLPDDEGMFFVNDEPEDVWYHMQNVMTPLDLIFMDENMKVISIKQIHHQTKMLVIIDDYVLLLFKITVYLLVKKYQV